MDTYTDQKGRAHRIVQTEPAVRTAAESERLFDELCRLLSDAESEK